MRTGFLGLVLTAMALGVCPALAQNVEQVKPVFEHLLPNTEGKSMIAVVVTYPPGAKSPAHHHARSAFIYAYVLSGAIRSQVEISPPKSTTSAKASTSCPVRTTGSVRMRAIAALRAYWPSLWSILKIDR
jgi:mannose-6-phosphate isomerase-like protein (cupin superfamily)